MKSVLILSLIVLAACGSSKPKRETPMDPTTGRAAESSEAVENREHTKVIYYEVVGIPKELQQDVRQAFDRQITKHSCWTAGDFGTEGSKDICAKFVPYEKNAKLGQHKDWYRRDMLLRLNVSQTTKLLRYRLKYDCYNGKKLYACANPGKYEFDFAGDQPGEAIVERLFSNSIVIGVK